MVTIVFETHSTSEDNEAGLASGWSDPNLSVRGKEQAKELGSRYRNKNFDTVFCSDMERAYQTVVAAFGNDPRLIFVDWRLRECDYGDFSLKPKDFIENERLQRISKPFPNGESYEDVKSRVQNLLQFLKTNYDGKQIVLLAHQAPQLALDVLLRGKTWQQAIDEDWRKTMAWQPGWEYTLN